MEINYDIIYQIYLRVDDYKTVCNFFLLNKTFLYDYIYRYQKTSFKHKFSVLFHYLFSFFHIMQFTTMSDTDMTFLMNLDSDISFRNDIFNVYHLYKRTISTSLSQWLMHYTPITIEKIAYIILTQGVHHIDRSTKVHFNRNKITLELKCTGKNWPDIAEISFDRMGVNAFNNFGALERQLT